MKTTRVKFSQLQNELEVLEKENLRGIKGGVAANNQQYQYAIDSNGKVYWRPAGTEDWYALNNLDTVVITPNGSFTEPPSFDWNNYYSINVPTNGGGGGGYGSSSGSGNNETGSTVGNNEGTSNNSNNISNNVQSLFDNLWNSSIVRYMIPDLISINISGNFVPGIGSGSTLSINLITRGDASLSATWMQSLRVGLHANASVNASIGYLLNNVNSASINTLLGKGVDAAFDAEAIGLGAWSSLGSNNEVTWLGGSIGVGPGAGGSIGVGENYLIYVNSKPLIWDF